MYASKLTFSKETRMKLASPALSPMAKRKLRQSRVLDFIRETPGHEATKFDLIAAAGYDVTNSTEYQNGWGLVTGMVKRGVIVPHDHENPTSKRKKQWIISSDVRVIEAIPPRPGYPAEAFNHLPDTGGSDGAEDKSEPNIEQPADGETITEISTAHAELLGLAKDFAWKQNSDSLREFIAWMER